VIWIWPNIFDAYKLGIIRASFLSGSQTVGLSLWSINVLAQQSSLLGLISPRLQPKLQQDSAPAHRARETIELLQRLTPDFISSLLWLPNSPDVNPVDYKVWSVLQERVYRSRIRDVSHLKERLVEEWSQFDQSIVDRALKEWQVRLKACVNVAGGHFEHKLQ
jgi:hypothetical protein